MILEFATIDELPAKLRQWRKDSGWTLKELAMRSGITLSFLAEIENGKTRPSFLTLQKLANVHNRTIAIAVKPNPQPKEQVTQ